MTTVRILFVALCAVAAFGKLDPEFLAFKHHFGKSYGTPEAEKEHEMIFRRNMALARQEQLKNPLARFGVNEFSDISPEEFSATHKGYSMELHKKARAPGVNRTVYRRFTEKEHKLYSDAQQVDWRARGAVTPIKNQGYCGGCWSFSTTGNIEGQWFLAGHPLTSLSEQELISCDTTDNGCHGGTMDNAWTWLVSARQGVIDTEASWPFVDGASNAPVPQCSYSGHKAGAVITGHYDIASSEREMATYCAMHGPISIAVDGTTFQTYNGGIVTNCVSQQLDHAVLIVGFDDTNNPPYWIVKNSWGTSWGEDGYIRIAKGSNQCLLTSAPGTSIVGNGPTPSPPPTSPSSGSGSGSSSASGSGGPTPAPPVPTSNASFQQLSCPDGSCADGCQSQTLPQDVCLSAGSGSVVATCSADGTSLNYAQYNSTDCSGTAQSLDVATSTCLQAASGTYLEFVCPSGSGSSSNSGSGFRQARVRGLALKPLRR